MKACYPIVLPGWTLAGPWLDLAKVLLVSQMLSWTCDSLELGSH